LDILPLKSARRQPHTVMARLLVLLLAAVVLVKADPAPWQAPSDDDDDGSVYGGVHGRYKFYGHYSKFGRFPRSTASNSLPPFIFVK